MAAPQIDAFGLEINLTSKGFDSIVHYFKLISEEGRKCGVSTADIDKKFTELRNALQTMGAPLDKINKAFAQFTEEQRRGQSTITRMQQLFKEGATVIGSFYASFAPIRKIYNFVDGIAAINFQLRMLHFSSGLGVNALSEFGAAAKMYGGSAQTYASGKQRYSQQIAMARRGQGLGYLQDAYWKFGFGFDLNESYEKRLERAIQHARSIKDEHDRIAFAQTVDPANAKYILAGASHTASDWKRYKDYFSSAEGWTNGSGENRVSALSKLTETYTQESEKLSRSWKGIKDQIATALLPVILKIVENVRKLTDWLNEHPKTISGITYAVSTLMAIFAGLSFMNATRTAIEFIGKLKTIKQLLWIMKGLWFPFGQLFKGSGWLLGKLGPLGGAISGKIAASFISLFSTLGSAWKMMGALFNPSGVASSFRLMGSGLFKLVGIGTKLGLSITSITVVLGVLAGAIGSCIGYFGIFKGLLEPWLKKEEDKAEKARRTGIHSDGTSNAYRNSIAFGYGHLVKWLDSDEAKSAPVARVERAKKQLKIYEDKLRKWKIPLENAIWAVENMESESEDVTIRNSQSKNDNRKSYVDQSRTQIVQNFQSSGNVGEDARTAAEAANGIRKGGQVANVTSERN